eukprot:COSAG01_NODE_38013_length_495_cov_3.189394_1_plen_132_part_01
MYPSQGMRSSRLRRKARNVPTGMSMGKALDEAMVDRSILTAAAAWKAVTDPKRLVTADVQEKAYKDAFRKRLKRREKEAEPQAKRPRRKGTSRASELADPFSFKGVDRKRPASSPSRQPSKALRARPGRAVT